MSLVESIIHIKNKNIGKIWKVPEKSRILLNKTGKIADIIYRTRNRIKVVV